MAHRASGALSPQLEPRTDPIRSTGDAVEQVWAEHSVSSDLVVRYRARLFRTELSVFSNTIDDNIEKQALILPAGAVGLLLAGQPVVQQAPGGAVFVAASSNPVLVRANLASVACRASRARSSGIRPARSHSERSSRGCGRASSRRVPRRTSRLCDGALCRPGHAVVGRTVRARRRPPGASLVARSGGSAYGRHTQPIVHQQLLPERRDRARLVVAG